MNPTKLDHIAYWVAGRDAILRLVDGTMRIVTAEGEENVAAIPAEPLSLTGLRDALDRWRRGAPRVTGSSTGATAP